MTHAWPSFLLIGLTTVVTACSGTIGAEGVEDAGAVDDVPAGELGGLEDASLDSGHPEDASQDAEPDAGTDVGLDVEGDDAGELPTVTQWQPLVVATLTSEQPHRWDDFPLQATFTHHDEELTVDGVWVGEDRWEVRFAATRVGVWSWAASTNTGDPGFTAFGSFRAVAPTSDEVARNANMRGHVKTEGQGFVYGDGTPLLLLGDTFWYFNAVRTTHKDNPEDPSTPLEVDRPLGDLSRDFGRYVDDRVSKGFNAVLVKYLSGHGRSGDTANEGGYLWDAAAVPPEAPIVDWGEINPAYFEALDQRMDVFFTRGLVVVGHPGWLGTIPDLTVVDAVNLSRYLLARYGAYNLIWSLTGEFHNACGRNGTALFCDGEYQAFRELGRWVGGSDDVSPARPGFNPFGHPMSLHPGGWDPDAPEPNNQTTRIFDGEDWLDHHWIQSYAETDKIVYRVSELRGMIDGGLSGELPVLMAEPSYEGGNNGRYTDWDVGSGAAKEASKARRQGWTSMFAGAAGHIYGAEGIWEATDTANLDFVGSGQMHHVKDFLLATGWPALAPATCVEVQVEGSWQAPALDYPVDPSTTDVLRYTFAPRCLMRTAETYAVYIPAGNDDQQLRLIGLAGQSYQAHWFDPRSGATVELDPMGAVNTDGDETYVLPARPSPSDNDWVFVLER